MEFLYLQLLLDLDKDGSEGYDGYIAALNFIILREY